MSQELAPLRKSRECNNFVSYRVAQETRRATASSAPVTVRSAERSLQVASPTRRCSNPTESAPANPGALGLYMPSRKLPQKVLNVDEKITRVFDRRIHVEIVGGTAWCFVPLNVVGNIFGGGAQVVRRFGNVFCRHGDNLITLVGSAPDWRQNPRQFNSKMRGGLHTSGGQGTRRPPRAWRHGSYVVGLPGENGLTAVPWLFQVIRSAIAPGVSRSPPAAPRSRGSTPRSLSIQLRSWACQPPHAVRWSVSDTIFWTCVCGYCRHSGLTICAGARI